MAIPKEFNYKDEDAFIQEFIIPLLYKLGFSLVVNYHGTAELGKDLIFAEVDRFGHVRYHGIQAKYVGSISLNAIEELITDCKQAFENPFTHPQTGATEKINSFYAVTGGTIGTDATNHYFNSVLKSYGANARLLQAKDLITLDRWATAKHRDNLSDLLAGLLVELDYNEHHIFPMLIESLSKFSKGTGTWPLWRLRSESVSSYLQQPFLTKSLNIDRMLNYWHFALLCNKETDLVGQGIFSPENRKAINTQAIEHLQKARDIGLDIRMDIVKVLQSLGIQKL